MSGTSETLARFERVYSAASRMLYAQEAPAWREHPQWPEERKAAFQELERLLLETGRTAPQAGEPSDPARHLISRRAAGSEDRPLTFGEAAEEWRQRLREDPGPLVERREPFHELYMEPGACVLIPSGRHLATTGVFWEMFARLAPGRPAMTMGQDGAELSRLAHEAADALRAPLGVPTPTPAPGEASWISTGTRWAVGIPDLARELDELSRAAWRAAETLPSPEEIKATRDFSVKFSVKMAAAKAALALREVLTRDDAPAWRERVEGIDPAAHGTVGLGTDGTPWSLASQAASWRELFDAERKPWTPAIYELPPEPELGATDTVLSAAVAHVFAEILDEFSARLRPGHHSGILHFDAFELGQFIVGEFGEIA
ncbi:hypothetical protein ACH4TX_12280 [Streptomyces sp. NPDC021098]|uniref:hypothetical protein n=1 Tax=unclassified Streptomyces TaxID=2593676 RepID=UPI00378CFBFC